MADRKNCTNMDDALIAFWNCEPVRDLTDEEHEILRKIENRIEKSGECFLHPADMKFEKKRVYVRHFVFGIFNKELCKNNQKLFLRCNKKTCVKPAHLIKTTQALGQRLQKIGWEHAGKSEKEIKRLFDLQILLESGKYDETTGCWLYAGFIGKHGYAESGGFVHRRRWKLENPEIALTPETCVRHKCKNRHCFEIEHLEIGSARENAKDRIRDETTLRGEKNPKVKLTKEIAQIIKNNYKEESIKIRAERYNVDRATVSKIDSGQNWSYLPYREQSNTTRGEVMETKMWKQRQCHKNRIPNSEDYENIWKKIKKLCKESSTETYDEMPCLLFQKTGPHGYGRISFASSPTFTHIVVWEKFHNNCQRQHDKTKVIRHLCGNRACVQPCHLKLGTRSENERDKRTHGTQRGISEPQVREVWRLKDVEGLKPKQISDKLGIKHRTIQGILYKERHLYIHKKNTDKIN